MIRLFVVSILCWATAAFADAVSISVTSVVVMGKGQPSVNVHILEPIAGYMLNLKRSPDGKVVELKGGGKVGQTRVLDLPQPEGKFEYAGALTVNFPNGSSSEMPLQFPTEMWGPLHMKCEKSDIDFEKRTLKLPSRGPRPKRWSRC